jgi:Flp pilus assembly protein TadG
MGDRVNQMTSPFRAGGQRRRGGILIEAALVILLLLVLTGGMIEFGWLIFVMHTSTGAARNGARAAIVAGAVRTDVDTAVTSVMSGPGWTSSQYSTEVWDKTTNTKMSGSTLPASGHDVAVHVKSTWSNIGVSFLGLVSSSRTIDCVVVMRKEG